MTQISAAEAVMEFDKLLTKAVQGQDIVIISKDGVAFKLIPLHRPPQPVFGSARGLVQIGPDFDAPIEGFEEYMP